MNKNDKLNEIGKNIYYIKTINNQIMDTLKDTYHCTIFYRYEEADIEIWKELYTKIKEIEFIQTKNIISYLLENKLH